MLNSFTVLALGAVLAFSMLAEARADDKKVDPAGNWSWTMKGRQGRPDRKITAKLKVEGEKVTGTISSPGRNGDIESPIEEGKIKGDEITFSTSREVNGNKMTYKYSGKVSGDTIKGKMDFERNGEPVHQEWEATRGEAK